MSDVRVIYRWYTVWKKIKLIFLKLFDNSLSKYLICKRISFMQCLFLGYLVLVNHNQNLFMLVYRQSKFMFKLTQSLPEFAIKHSENTVKPWLSSLCQTDFAKAIWWIMSFFLSQINKPVNKISMSVSFLLNVMYSLLVGMFFRFVFSNKSTNSMCWVLNSSKVNNREWCLLPKSIR